MWRYVRLHGLLKSAICKEFGVFIERKRFIFASVKHEMAEVYLEKKKRIIYNIDKKNLF